MMIKIGSFGGFSFSVIWTLLLGHKIGKKLVAFGHQQRPIPKVKIAKLFQMGIFGVYDSRSIDINNENYFNYRRFDPPWGPNI